MATSTTPEQHAPRATRGFQCAVCRGPGSGCTLLRRAPAWGHQACEPVRREGLDLHPSQPRPSKAVANAVSDSASASSDAGKSCVVPSRSSRRRTTSASRTPARRRRVTCSGGRNASRGTCSSRMRRDLPGSVSAERTSEGQVSSMIEGKRGSFGSSRSLSENAATIAESDAEAFRDSREVAPANRAASAVCATLRARAPLSLAPSALSTARTKALRFPVVLRRSRAAGSATERSGLPSSATAGSIPGSRTRVARS